MPRTAGCTAVRKRQEGRSHDVRERGYSEGRRNGVLLADQVRREAQGEQPAPAGYARHGHAGGARHEPGDRAALSFPLQAPEESENEHMDETDRAKQKDAEAPAEILGELDGLIGLDEVKAQVRETVNLAELGK